MNKELPADFRQSMIDILGAEEYSIFEESLQQPTPTSIRLNPKKKHTTPEGESIPWCSVGMYLKTRPSFTFDPLFHAGTYYVQEASSMFVGHIISQVIQPQQPLRVLDMCAAPGGKSTLALSCLPEGSLLIANEVVRQRAQVLGENITKWGNPYTIVTNNYAQDFKAFHNAFDLIICDVPCSGEGMFRKDDQAITEWSPANVRQCVDRQREILSDIWHCLRPGGHLIYSTCTFNTKEDEENVLWISEKLGASIIDCNTPDQWSIVGNLLKDKDFPAYHFMPHKTKGEGFFACLLQKSEEEDEDYDGFVPYKNKKNGKAKNKPLPIPKEIKSWTDNDVDLTIYEKNGNYYAFPTLYQDMLHLAETSLHIVCSGIQLATMKGKNLQPSHALAMSNHLLPEAFPRVDITYDQAIAYLRTEAITLPADTPKGYVLLTYQSVPLGFAKNIGNRANNLYPSEWRIRSI